MSDTPRTDAAATISICSGVEMVRPGFARELERENARLREALAAQNAGVADTAACRERVTQETASSVSPAPDDDPYKPVPHDERKMLLSRIEELERRVAELERYDVRRLSICEAGAFNPSILEYMKHWEGRVEKAERRVAELTSMIESNLREIFPDLCYSDGRPDLWLDAAVTLTKVHRERAERAEQEAARLREALRPMTEGTAFPGLRITDAQVEAARALLRDTEAK